MNDLVWHDVSKKPEKNVGLIIVENLAYDCKSKAIRGYHDGENFVFEGSNGEKFIVNDVLEWAYDVDGFIDKKSEDIADYEYEYSLSDPDWDNIQRAAEKGIKAGIEWYKKHIANENN